MSPQPEVHQCAHWSRAGHLTAVSRFPRLGSAVPLSTVLSPAIALRQTASGDASMSRVRCWGHEPASRDISGRQLFDRGCRKPHGVAWPRCWRRRRQGRADHDGGRDHGICSPTTQRRTSVTTSLLSERRVSKRLPAGLRIDHVVGRVESYQGFEEHAEPDAAWIQIAATDAREAAEQETTFRRIRSQVVDSSATTPVSSCNTRCVA